MTVTCLSDSAYPGVYLDAYQVPVTLVSIQVSIQVTVSIQMPVISWCTGTDHDTCVRVLLVVHVHDVPIRCV